MVTASPPSLPPRFVITLMEITNANSNILNDGDGGIVRYDALYASLICCKLSIAYFWNNFNWNCSHKGSFHRWDKLLCAIWHIRNYVTCVRVCTKWVSMPKKKHTHTTHTVDSMNRTCIFIYMTWCFQNEHYTIIVQFDKFHGIFNQS